MKQLCSLFLACGLLLTVCVLPAAAAPEESFDYDEVAGYEDAVAYDTDYEDSYAYDEEYAYAEDAYTYGGDEYVETCEYEEGSSEEDEPMPLGNKIAVAIGAGLVIGLITVLVLRSQLKSVRMQSGAASYIRPDSMRVDVSSDIYLYSRVTKVALPKDNKD